MNKKLRELLSKIEKNTELAKGYLEGENKDVTKAAELMGSVEELKKEYEVELKIYEADKKLSGPSDKDLEKFKKGNENEVDGFVMISKMINRQPLNEVEKSALLSATETGANGEENLLPADVQLAIRELRREHLSAKDLTTVTSVTALSGQYTYDVADTQTLSPLADGDTIVEAEAPKFRNVQWAVEWYAKILPVSRILIGAEKAGLMQYLNRWFIKSAVNTENGQIFDTLRTFNTTPKPITGWEVLKKSLTVDLDPALLLDTVIVTNQTGFAILDEEKDENGRPILQEDPSDKTRRVFQGYPVVVFSNAQLADLTTGTKAPIFYGSIKAGLSFIEYENLQFAVSEHFLFNKNQNAMRVMEAFTLLKTDDEAVIYGALEATPPSGE